MCKKCAECLRDQLVSNDDAGRSSACEILVRILIVFAECERDDLSCDVCREFLLACGALDIQIVVHLVVLEADELHRNDLCALMKQLVEGMLSVCAGLAVDDRACLIVDRFAEAVNALAVGFHVKLLQMCRETAQSL